MGDSEVDTASTPQLPPPHQRGRLAVKIVTLQCPYCPRTITGNPSKSIRTNYNRHLLTHTKERPYQCEFCLMKFTTSSNRRRHILRLHQEMAAQWINPPPAAQEAPAKMKVEDEAKDLNSTVALECRFCKMTFSCKGTRTLHERHCSSRPHPPRKLCSSNSLMPDAPTESLATSTDDPAEAFFICPNCEQELSGRQQLKRHMKCYCPFRDDVFALCSEDEYFLDVNGTKDREPGFSSRTRRSRRILSQRRLGFSDYTGKRLQHEMVEGTLPERTQSTLLRSAEALLAASQPRARGPTTVVCPYDDCMSTFSSRRRWLKHVARRHPQELLQEAVAVSS